MIYILDEIKKLFLAGIGAASVTYDKAMDMIDQLVEKGRLTVEEGKILSEELKQDVKMKAESIKTKTNEKIEEMKPATKDDLEDILKKLDYATKDEIADIKMKIKELESKIGNK